MPCYRPQPATMGYNPLSKKWSRPRILYPNARAEDGARSFPKAIGDTSSVFFRCPEHRYTTLPCGVCFGCRTSNARDWSLRMMHTSRYASSSYFVTLTYSDDYMPDNGMLDYRDLQLFFKNARHYFQDENQPFKYFACGEYGDKTLRPHYHFAGFNFKFDDLRPFKQTKSGWYYLSQSLREVWEHGHVIVAPLTWQSAAYIARYVTKKMHGANRRYLDEHDPLTGEFLPFPVERAFQSKGLGLDWYNDNHKEIWDLDGCLYNNKYLVKPPRYYMKQLEKADPAKALFIKEQRLKDQPFTFLDQERDKELLYSMEATRLQMQTLHRSL